MSLSATILTSVADPAFNLMLIRSYLSLWCGSGSEASFQIKAQKLKKCSNRLIFHTFWLGICKLMRIQIRVQIQLITLMRMRIRIQLITLMRKRIRIQLITLSRCGSGYGSYGTFQFDADPCGSGSTTLILTLLSEFQYQICYLSITVICHYTDLRGCKDRIYAERMK